MNTDNPESSLQKSPPPKTKRRKPSGKKSAKKSQPEKRPRDPEARMTFTEHLAELRERIIYSGIALVVCFCVAYGFSEQILDRITQPLRAAGIEWVILSAMEAFVVRLKLSLYGGVALASPFLIWQACAFVFPGLKPGEKRAVQFLLAGGSFLAVAGISVSYWGILPLVLPYLLQWTPEWAKTTLRIQENVSLLIMFYGAFAVAFQFPMVVLILVWLDLLSPETLRAYRKISIVGIAIASAVLTPPDPISMVMMMIPLVLLYEVSIWASYLLVWRRRKDKRAQETAGKKSSTDTGATDSAPSTPQEGD